MWVDSAVHVNNSNSSFFRHLAADNSFAQGQRTATTWTAYTVNTEASLSELSIQKHHNTKNTNTNKQKITITNTKVKQIQTQKTQSHKNISLLPGTLSPKLSLLDRGISDFVEMYLTYVCIFRQVEF